MSDLNVFQQICAQMFTVNLDGMFIGPESLLQKAMNKAATHLIEKSLGKYGWKITWGPRVWKSPKSKLAAGLDNCWMISMAPGVVYPDGTKYDTYVVAIAGTAVFSKTDWVEEDFGVNHCISFDAFTRTFKDGPIPEPQKTPKGPGDDRFCAWGTAWGIYQLVTNTSPDGNPGEKTTILQYLAGLNKDGGDFRVIFAGHSLGGALSPFLSLAVKANTLIPALADTPDNILTFPAAGATPGDGLFRDSYNKLFPVSGPGGYQQWNANFFNTLDIVPQAWSTDDKSDRFLDKIVTIYGNLEEKLHDKVQKYVDAAKKHANASGITYEPIKGNPFTGKPPKNPPKYFATFLAQALKQHTKAYHDQTGNSKVVAQLYSMVADTAGVKKKTAYQAALSLPVLRLGADLAKENIPEGFWGGDDDEGAPDNTFDGVPKDVVAYPYDCVLAV